MTVSHKLPLSSDHLAAAVVFATQAREFEQGRLRPLVLHERSEHTAASIGCILSAVGYLEANINEFFSDAAEEGMSDGVAASPAVLQRLRSIRSTMASKTTILDKYDIVLALCDLPTFDKGAAPYQGVAKLIKLRNALTHFVPEWQPGGGPQEGAELDALSRSLRGVFPENDLAARHEPFFPYRCLGYGSSKWAVTQSIAFVTEFMKRLGVGFSPNYILGSVEKL